MIDACEDFYSYRYLIIYRLVEYLKLLKIKNYYKYFLALKRFRFLVKIY